MVNGTKVPFYSFSWIFNNSFPKNCSCSPMEHCSMQKRCAPAFPLVCRKSFFIGQSMQKVSISSSISLITALLFTNPVPPFFRFYILLSIFFICQSAYHHFPVFNIIIHAKYFTKIRINTKKQKFLWLHKNFCLEDYLNNGTRHSCSSSLTSFSPMR